MKWFILLSMALLMGLSSCSKGDNKFSSTKKNIAKGTSKGISRGTAATTLKGSKVDWKNKSDDYWKKNLDPLTYEVTRKAGTEKPFTGKYLNWKEDGTFTCSNCGQKLFDSKTKYDSGTGWPSFSDVVNKGNVILKEDHSAGMVRTEVLCSRCNAHLGHVFKDGPKSTGLRYCINSASLSFKEDEKED